MSLIIFPDVELDYLKVIVTNIGNDSVTLKCTTVYQSSTSYYKVDLDNGMESRSVFTSNTANVTFTGLMSGTQHTYTASLVNDSNATFPDACIMFIDTFNTTGEAPTLSSTIINSPTASSSVQSSTTSTPGPTETPGK